MKAYGFVLLYDAGRLVTNSCRNWPRQ